MFGAILGSAAGALGGIFGGISKNKTQRKQMSMINDLKRENQNWYDRRYNEDATQRADAQRILTMTAENFKRRNRAAAGTAAVMGGSEESVAATKEANAQALADATSQIAAAGEQRKDQIENQYLNRKNELDEKLRELQGQKLNGWDMASNAIGGAVSGLSMGLG